MYKIEAKIKGKRQNICIAALERHGLRASAVPMCPDFGRGLRRGKGLADNS
jgi:hypothetical protein